MSEETISTNTVKAASDGSVKIAVEKYNELLETIADQKDQIREVKERLSRALAEPPVINRTVVHKTTEILAQEHRAWGWTFIGAGAALVGVGAIRVRLGRTES